MSALLTAMIGLAAGAYWGWQSVGAFADRPITPRVGSLRVQRGDRMADLIKTLRQAGVTQGMSIGWMWLAYQTGAAGHLKVGEYALDAGLTPRVLLERIRQGHVIQYRFTIIEGWTMRQLREALDHASPLQHTLATTPDRDLMQSLHANVSYAEGWFLPNTYLYQRGMSDRDILARAYRAMRQSLARVWATRAEHLPLQTADQALVLASIIEKETGLAAERQEISGVFIRRLQRGMRLQTDPSVIYGLGDQYTGSLHKKNLATDSPYNTYTRPGLPPTPIAMPGIKALEAAVHPAPGDAVYFVAKKDGSGGHQFSATLAEHNHAVTQLIQQIQKNRHNDPINGQ